MSRDKVLTFLPYVSITAFIRYKFTHGWFRYSSTGKLRGDGRDVIGYRTGGPGERGKLTATFY